MSGILSAPLTWPCSVCQCVWNHRYIFFLFFFYSEEYLSWVHLFVARMQAGIQTAIKTRASGRCSEMDLHPNSSRGLALTLLRMGSESISWKPSLLNRKSDQFGA